jgi:hypothetical protein
MQGDEERALSAIYVLYDKFEGVYSWMKLLMGKLQTRDGGVLHREESGSGGIVAGTKNEKKKDMVCCMISYVKVSIILTVRKSHLPRKKPATGKESRCIKSFFSNNKPKIRSPICHAPKFPFPPAQDPSTPSQSTLAKDMCQQISNRSLLLCLVLRVDLSLLDRILGQCLFGWESSWWAFVSSDCREKVIDVDPDVVAF